MADQEKLVIASKIKSFIKEKGDMNTSSGVVDALSNLVASECEKAIENAKRGRRKTVMDRDFDCGC